MNRRSLFCVLLAVSLSHFDVSAAPQTAKPSCDWSAFDRNAAGLRAARDAAQTIPEEEGNTRVPPEAIKQIQQFKNSLHDALQGYFACQPPGLPKAHAAERDLYARFAVPAPAANKKNIGGPNDPGPWTGLYLSDITFEVRTVADTRKLIAVLTTFGIPYGGDAEVDVYALNDRGSWEPTVHLTSTPYNSVWGAFSAFDYKISPTDSKGKWFLVATHINPWPTSCWQSLFIDVVQSDYLWLAEPLFHSEQSGYICTDQTSYLRNVTSSTFQIQFDISSIDESVLHSPSLMTYTVEGYDVTRIPPIALDPVNFVDEWTRRTWLESQGWSAPNNLAVLRREHGRLHGSDGDFVGWRSCTAPTLSQVEFSPGSGDPDLFFLVKHSGPNWTMLHIGKNPNASCKGPNHPPIH